MKKTFATILALVLATPAMAEEKVKADVTDLRYMGNGTKSITEISQWGYFTQLADDSLITREGTVQEAGTQPNAKNEFTYNERTYSTLESITSYGNADFNLVFNTTSFTVTIDEALYFNRVTALEVTNSVWNFGSSGSITSVNRKNPWGGGIEFKQTSACTFNLTVTDEQMGNLECGDLYKRDLMTSLDTEGNGIWNVANNLTINAAGLETYSYVGLVTDLASLEMGQYGFTISNPDANDKYAGDCISFVFRAIPEPGTATLSLLALAGLAARRRRK